MPGKVYQRTKAERDLVEDFVYLAEHAGIETADRFLASADKCFATLAKRPQIGTPLTPLHPKLAGLRRWRVTVLRNFRSFMFPAKTAFRSCACCMPRKTGGTLLGFSDDGTYPVPLPPGRCSRWRCLR